MIWRIYLFGLFFRIFPKTELSAKGGFQTPIGTTHTGFFFVGGSTPPPSSPFTQHPAHPPPLHFADTGRGTVPAGLSQRPPDPAALAGSYLPSRRSVAEVGGSARASHLYDTSEVVNPRGGAYNV